VIVDADADADADADDGVIFECFPYSNFIFYFVFFLICGDEKTIVHIFLFSFTHFISKGFVGLAIANQIAKEIRIRKVMGMKGIPMHTEVALISSMSAKQYPTLHFFSGSSRMVRPVRNLICDLIEWIGSYEQVFLNIAVTPAEIKPLLHSHVEISPVNMLSVNAAMTPFSDFNQSPRNMYQCQMGKQTMATPCHALPFRADNKLYKLQTPQIPNVMTESHTNYCMNDYPQGTNAVIAVISYTGYDMEDAMILNKGAFERGFAHASVYTTSFIDLSEIRGDTSTPHIQAVVIAAHEPVTSEELFIQEGDMVRILDKNYGVAETCRVMSFSSRESGYVPCSCLQVVRPGMRSIAKRDVINSVGEIVVVKGEIVDVIRDLSSLEQEVFVPSTGGIAAIRIGLLEPIEGNRSNSKYFDNRVRGTNAPFEKKLDIDGLPFVGTPLKEGDPMYCYYDEENCAHTVVKYKKLEPSCVDQVTVICQSGKTVLGIDKISLKLRFNRNPIIGDKFSSRHGQKGVCSQQWPQENMPFTESGLTPDVIINPHAFPSRMTIGMLIETMAAKAGCLHGLWQDATPFQFSEKSRAVDYFGEQLVKAGYNYYGNEPMYSGVSGEEFQSQIFFGVVYYQRLRHMVSDKYQVRSTGPINSLTKQPIKGRKKGGGIRFGEMERDSLLAHGVSFMLRDRLMKCSDFDEANVCNGCGSIVTPMSRGSQIICSVCNDSSKIVQISLPHVFRYMTAELAAMNIRVSVETKSLV
jgi:DNA-directed RNA polymerase beta subunit